jgi:hypothetical protein
LENRLKEQQPQGGYAIDSRRFQPAASEEKAVFPKKCDEPIFYFIFQYKKMNTKTRSIIGWSLAGLLALLFTASAAGKFMDKGEGAAMLGGANNVLILGVVEVVMVILSLIPRTAIIGVFMMVAYMGGAIAFHLTKGEPIIVQSIIQSLIWITAAFRFPALTADLFGNKIALK